MSRLVLTLIVTLSLASGAITARADEDKGMEALEGARSALAEGDFATARTKALVAIDGIATDPRLREALMICGQAHLGAGERQKGLGRIRTLLTLLEGAVPLSEEDQGLWTRARTILVKASPDDAALDTRMRKQAGKLASISKKWVKKDPKAAERAALAALALDPTHEKAQTALAKARAGLAGTPEELLDVRTMSQWTWLTAKNWPRKDGVLIGHVEDTAMSIRTNRKWSGNFDVIVEARLIEPFRKNGPPLFTILAPYVTDERHISFGYMTGSAELYECTSATEGTSAAKKKFAELTPPLDPREWLTYELRFRKNEVIALVGGVEVGRHPRASDLQEGPIGLKVQFAKVEFRRVAIVRR